MEFVTIKDEWNTLWQEAVYRTPYQSWEWNHSWIVNSGQTSSLYVVVVVDSNGVMRGIAPLRTSFHIGTIRVLSFVSQEATAYPDFIVHKDADADMIRRIVQFLKSDNKCSALDLKLAEPSPHLTQLRDALQRTGWCQFMENGYTKRLKVSIGDNYDAYMASLSRDMRQDIRAANRKLGEKFAVRFAVSGQDSDFEADMAELFRLQALKWGGDPRSNFPTYRDYFRSGHLCDGVKLFVLSCDGMPVGAVAASLLDNTIYLEMAGFDFSILKVDLGKIFYSNLIRWAIEHGYSYVDFMTGDQEYKYRYNPEQTVKWKLSAYKSERAHVIVDKIHAAKGNILSFRNRITQSTLCQNGKLRTLVDRFRRIGGS